MRELSLFTGAGGGICGSKILGWQTLGYVEFEDYPQRVIAQRIEDGFYDRAPIFGDVRTFISEGYADAYQGMVDIVSGGFPCQPFSVAGSRQAGDDSRDMWPATIEVIRRVRPRWAFLENVPGLLSATDDVHGTYFGRVLGDLAKAGYDAEWTVLGADDVGAPHRRKRLWILAHAQRPGTGLAGWRESGAGTRGRDASVGPESAMVRQELGPPSSEGPDAGGPDVANTEQGKRDAGAGEPGSSRRGEPGYTGWWDVEPQLGRVANGVANRTNRLKAIGNGQVPQTMAAAFLELMARYEV